MVIMGIDLGKARTGLAVCDKGEILASPFKVIEEREEERLIEKLMEAAKESKAERLVVGLPRNMDGSEGESAQNARRLGAILQERCRLPVEFQDERGTTVSAHGFLNETNTRGKKRKAVVDAVAAVIILQAYLDRRKSGGGKAEGDLF